MYPQYVLSYNTIPFSKPRLQKDNIQNNSVQYNTCKNHEGTITSCLFKTKIDSTIAKCSGDDWLSSNTARLSSQELE